MNFLVKGTENALAIRQRLIWIIADLIAQRSREIPSHRLYYGLACATVPFTGCWPNICHHVCFSLNHHCNLNFKRKVLFCQNPQREYFLPSNTQRMTIAQNCFSKYLLLQWFQTTGGFFFAVPSTRCSWNCTLFGLLLTRSILLVEIPFFSWFFGKEFQ